MNSGLPEKDIQVIREIISRFPEITKVILFGSRAMGNFKRGSDVDLALAGEEIPEKTASRIAYLLNEETTLPWYFDVVDTTRLHHPGLQEHIEKYGIIIYRKKPAPSTK